MSEHESARLSVETSSEKLQTTRPNLAKTTQDPAKDSDYPHDGHADKNPYPHDRRANKDSYPHDSNNQCIILRLQQSFVMINVQLMLV